MVWILTSISAHPVQFSASPFLWQLKMLHFTPLMRGRQENNALEVIAPAELFLGSNPPVYFFVPLCHSLFKLLPPFLEGVQTVSPMTVQSQYHGTTSNLLIRSSFSNQSALMNAAYRTGEILRLQNFPPGIARKREEGQKGSFTEQQKMKQRTAQARLKRHSIIFDAVIM